MPTSLTKKFIAHQKDLLEAVLERLSGKRRDQQEHAATPQTGDLADTGNAVIELEHAMNLAANSRQTLQEVVSALDRIRRGVYGICEISGVEIPLERLEYLPWARFTAAEQANQERNKTRRSNTGSGMDSMFESAVAETDKGEEEEEEEAAKK